MLICKNEWSLKSVYFIKETKTIEFSAQSMEDINSAKNALEALLNDKKIASTSIDFKYDKTHMYLNKKGFAFNKALESLLKTHQLTRGIFPLYKHSIYSIYSAFQRYKKTYNSRKSRNN